MNREDWKYQARGAGELGAGDLKAGSLVVGTPALRQQTGQWLMDQMTTADELFQENLHVAQNVHVRDIDYVVLAQAQQTRTMLLWLAQCAGLIEVADAFGVIMTLGDDDQAIVRHAQRVAEERCTR